MSNTNAWAWLNGEQVYGDAVVIHAATSEGAFSVLQSSIHDLWLRRFSSSMRTDIRYGPADSFETFPFPEFTAASVQILSAFAVAYSRHRGLTCLQHILGLTKVYNLLHDPATERDDAPVKKAVPPFDDIRRLRVLHVEMDRAVLAAYGWEDLDLRHAFYRGRDAGTGVDEDDFRFTIQPAARAEILRRLLALNHERAAEEAAMLERGETIPSAFHSLGPE
ncbi:MAG: hypothetical protein IT186_24060 [Acidobacteria bacterium]|nr:hypothetical protein [Acidobacteriota bacterium]